MVPVVSTRLFTGSQSRRPNSHDASALRVSTVSLQRSAAGDANARSAMALPARLAEAQSTLQAAQIKVNEKRSQLSGANVQLRMCSGEEKQAKAELSRVSRQLRAAESTALQAEKGLKASRKKTSNLADALAELKRNVSEKEKASRLVERLLCPEGDLDELRAMRESVDTKTLELRQHREKLGQLQAEQRGLDKDAAKLEKKRLAAQTKLQSVGTAREKLTADQAAAMKSKEEAEVAQAESATAVSTLESAIGGQQAELKKMQAAQARQRRAAEAARLEEQSQQSKQRSASEELLDAYQDIQSELPTMQAATDANPELQLSQLVGEEAPLALQSSVRDDLLNKLAQEDDADIDAVIGEEEEEVQVLAQQRDEASSSVDRAAIEADSRLKSKKKDLLDRQQKALHSLGDLGVQRESQMARRETTFQAGFTRINNSAAELYKQMALHGDFHLSAPVSLDNNSLAEGVQMFCKEALISPEWKPVELLSGGQQALAALALTLGMSAVFPCPFYCVDEIDAALDTRAVAAVARVVQQLSSPSSVAKPAANLLEDSQATPSKGAARAPESTPDKTASGDSPCQFVVVSHRPQMYERATRLIGVFTRGGRHRGASTACGWNPPILRT